MNRLTKAEEQVMQILWHEKKAFVKDMILKFKEPKPAYNTVSTVIRTLEKKGFVSYKAYGKTHEYYPTISKNEYSRFFFKGFLKDYFNNSFKKMVSFFSKDEDISLEELVKIKEVAEELIKLKKLDQN